MMTNFAKKEPLLFLLFLAKRTPTFITKSLTNQRALVKTKSMYMGT